MTTFSGGTIDGNILPTQTGKDLGASLQRWDAFLQDLDVSGTVSPFGTLTIDTLTVGKLNNIRFVDGVKFTTIDAAVNDIGANPGLVIVPSTYAGAAVSVTNKNITIWDFRTAGVMRLYTAAAANAGSTGAQLFLRNDSANVQPTVTNLRNQLMAMTVGSGNVGTGAGVYGYVFWEANMNGVDVQVHNGVFGETQLFNITGWNASAGASGGEFKATVSGSGNTATMDNLAGVFGFGQVGPTFSGGTVTTMSGVEGQLLLPAGAAGTITDFRAIYGKAISTGGGTTTVTNAYGGYFEDPGYGSNRWGLRVASGEAQFDGLVDVNSGDLRVQGVASPSVQIIGSVNPQVRTQDTTNTVIAKVQSLDTTGSIGTESNHALDFITNNARVGGFSTSGGFDSVGKYTNYNSIATVGNGIPAEYATVDLTAQTAAKTATLLYAVPAAGQGVYRVSWVATVTTAATTSCVLGGAAGFQVQFTSSTDSVVKLSNPTTPTISAINATGTTISGTCVVFAKLSTNLNYLFDYTSVGGTPMAYELHIICEKL